MKSGYFIIMFLGLFLMSLLLIIAEEPVKIENPKWDFEPEKLAQDLCKKNEWEFKNEVTNTSISKYFKQYKFFEAAKPLDKTNGNLVILVISNDKKDYILHNTISFDDILKKESVYYPPTKENALEIALIKEELSRDYELWAPYYDLQSKTVNENLSSLLWEITFVYQRPALRAYATIISEGNKPPLTIVQHKDSVLPKERVLTRTVQLEHPIRPQVVKLIELLGDDNWETRENATNGLIAIGKPCVGLVKEALNHSDPEIRMRARLILEQIK